MSSTPSRVRRKLQFATGVGLAVTCLGLAPIAKKSALNAGADPIPLAIGVTAVAALAAVAAQGISAWRTLGEQTPRNFLWVALVGALGSGAVVALSLLAMMHTSATNRSLFQAMYPVATAIAARLLLGERLSGRAYAVMASMCFGLMLMNASGAGLELGSAFWMLAATLPLIGLADVIAKRSLADVDPGFVTAGRLVSGALVLGLLLPLTGRDQWLAIGGLWPLVLAAGLAMAGGVLGLYRAMGVATASLTAAFVALAPVITALTEWLALGSVFGGIQWAGIVLTVGGAIWLAVRE